MDANRQKMLLWIQMQIQVSYRLTVSEYGDVDWYMSTLSQAGFTFLFFPEREECLRISPKQESIKYYMESFLLNILLTPAQHSAPWYHIELWLHLAARYKHVQTNNPVGPRDSQEIKAQASRVLAFWFQLTSAECRWAT